MQTTTPPQEVEAIEVVVPGLTFAPPVGVDVKVESLRKGPTDPEVKPVADRDTDQDVLFWNTGCYVIYNNTSNPLYVIDLEDPFYRMTIPVANGRAFQGVKFPWCSDLNEVRTKAFSFHSGMNRDATRLFYMFQYYSDNIIYWLSASATDFNLRQYAGAPPSSYVDVFVNANNGIARPKCIQVW